MNDKIDVLAAKWRRYADGNYSDAANARSRCADELDALAPLFAELIASADAALYYVDEAAKAERARHITNGAANSLVLAQSVADNLRAALASVGGAQ